MYFVCAFRVRCRMEKWSQRPKMLLVVSFGPGKMQSAQYSEMRVNNKTRTKIKQLIMPKEQRQHRTRNRGGCGGGGKLRV